MEVGGSSIPAGSRSPPGSVQGDTAQPDHGAWQDIPSPRRHHAVNAPRQRPSHPPRDTRVSAEGKAFAWGAAKVHLLLILAKVNPLRQRNLVFQTNGVFLLLVKEIPSYRTKCFGLGGFRLMTNE